MRRLCILILGATLCLSGCRRAQPEVKLEPASVTLEVEPGSVRLEPGLATKVKVAVTRTNFADALKLDLQNLPQGLSATPVMVGANETTGEIELTATPSIAPGDKPGVRAFANAGDLQPKSNSFSVTVLKPTITYAFEPTHLKLPKGETRQLKVTIQRGREAYKGPVEIVLANLPKNVTATAKANSPDGAVFSVQAGSSAPEGETQPLVHVVGEKQLRGVGPFPLTVQGDPFVLKVEPARVKGVFGQATKVKITATRKDYQGPIALRLDLPGNIKNKVLTVPAKQTTGEIELNIPFDAVSLEKTIPVRGNADDGRHATTNFHLAVEGRPFTIFAQPGRLEVVQGTSAKLKVTAQRAKDFTGAISLEVRNLPRNCKASSPGIPLQSNSGEIEITADDAAALGDTAGIQIVGSALIGADTRELKANFALNVLAPFALQMQPAKVELVEGQKATMKVNALRRTYKGAIALQLKNLPAGVTATDVVIPGEQNSVEVELTAGPGSSGKFKPDVHAVGTAANKKQFASTNVTVLVLSKLFELKVDKAVKLTFGSKSAVKVAATRYDYQGPIALDLKNLPAQTKAARVVIPAGQNEIDVEISAADDAKEISSKAQIVGTATAAGNQQRVSDDFLVQLVPGLFDLKIEPALLQLHHGSSAKVTVTAQRKGHDGPIAIELKNLPAMMKADKATIAKGENKVEIEVKAQATVTEGAKVDAFARSSVAGKNIDSPRFIVSVVSIGQEPLLQLRVEPTTIKLAPGATAKVKVSAQRKGYTGPVAVDLRNLSADVESSKGMIAAGENDVEITLTARAKAEPIIKSDVCAVGIAVASENRAFASPQITLQVGRK